ncbi:MAG: polysaccharide deacetylase family protein [Pseudomonadota bacterium]
MAKRAILNFHGIGSIPDHIEDAERPFWIDQDRFEGLAHEIAKRRANGQDVMITFDDGNKSDLEIAAPILDRLGLKASFFVLTGRIGQQDYLSVSNIQRLHAMGMGIGLHGHDHVDWRQLDSDRLDVEVPQARATIADIIGQPIDTVGIPFGAYNRRVMSYLGRHGFKAIFTSDGDTARSDARVQPRLSVRSDLDEAPVRTFLDDTARFGDRLNRRVRRFLKQHVI